MRSKWQERARELRAGIARPGEAHPVAPPIPAEVVEETWQRMAQMDPADTPALMERFGDEQPLMLAYLVATADALLNEDEKELQVYLGTVVWQILTHGGRQLPHVSEKELDRIEDRNLARLDRLAGKPDADFERVARETIERSPQPEVLRYVVQGIFEDPEEGLDLRDEMTGLIFLHLKTVIDCWGK